MNISVSKIQLSLAHFLGRFHVLIFTIIVAGGLAVTMILINNAIMKSSDATGYTPNVDNATFDQATIDKVKKLKLSTEQPTPLNTSNGRSNPFVE